MSDLVLDASLALQWFLEDETGRQYGLSVLASLSTKRAVVPILWFYEVQRPSHGLPAQADHIGSNRRISDPTNGPFHRRCPASSNRSSRVADDRTKA